MTAECSSALALMHIHYGHDVDYDRVVNLFVKMHSRKLDCLNLVFTQ